MSLQTAGATIIRLQYVATAGVYDVSRVHLFLHSTAVYCMYCCTYQRKMSYRYNLLYYSILYTLTVVQQYTVYFYSYRSTIS